MAGKVKDENYITVQGWMINRLGLSGNDLLAYAIIYGFSQADGQYMTCSQEYIANWLNVTRVNANRILKRLVENGLVEKRLAKTKGAVKLYDYKAVTSIEKLHVTSNEKLPATSNKKLHVTSNEMLHHNKRDKYNNKFNNYPQTNYNIEEIEKQILSN